MFFLAGIASLCRAYNIGATDPEAAGYQSILSQLTAAVMGHSWFYYLTIGSILAVLSLSANTSYADFPRLTRAIALKDYLPQVFLICGRRRLYSHGVYALVGFTALLLMAKFAEGAWITAILIPALIITMAQIKNHYNCVRDELAINSPMRTDSRVEPLVIVPLDHWTRITQKGPASPSRKPTTCKPCMWSPKNAAMKFGRCGSETSPLQCAIQTRLFRNS